MGQDLREIDLEKLNLVLYPHESLITESKPFIIKENSFENSKQIKSIAKRLVNVLQTLPGIGLAANQIGINYRIFVSFVDLNHPEQEKHIQVYVNPKILSVYGGMEYREEGCLSFPGIKGIVRRHKTINMSYLNVEGEEMNTTSTGLQARCWQHEIDHLNGINIISRFNKSCLKRNSIAIKRLEKR